MLKWIWGNPLIQSFSNEPQKGYIEVEPDAGVPFRRLRFSDIQDLVTCNFSLTRRDYPRFMSWYKQELRQGTIPFEIYDCRYKINRTARLVGDIPKYQTNSNRYNLTLTMAFESVVINENRYLTVNSGVFLVVNQGDRLVVSYNQSI